VRKLCETTASCSSSTTFAPASACTWAVRASCSACGPTWTTYCKAIANGYPLGRVPRARQPEACGDGSILHRLVLHQRGADAASLANLKELQASGGIERMRATGEKLRTGLLAQARSAGIEVTYSGPAGDSLLTFQGRRRPFRSRESLCRRVLAQRRVHRAAPQLVHLGRAPDRDIEQTLNVTEQAFAAVRKQFGA